MKEVDFAYVDNDGFTIYRMCFSKYISAQFREEWTRLQVVPETEKVFDFLVAEGRKNGFDVDLLLERPNSTGETCFDLASRCSKKICKYILGRGIKVNSIKTDMMIPGFEYPDLSIQMMEEGINPRVISYSGNSQVGLCPSSFKDEKAKLLLAQFPRSIHF